MVRRRRECVKWRNGKYRRNYENYTQTRKDTVENSPLLKYVPADLPSAALSSRCLRANFKKILAAGVFSTRLLFRLSALTQTMLPLTNPDTYVWYRELDSRPQCSVFCYVYYKNSFLMKKAEVSLCFQNVCVSAVFPQLSNKSDLHVFTPSWKTAFFSVRGSGLV